MVRHITLLALADLETDRRARGNHDVLLDNPAGNAAAELRLRTAYLGWAQIEGLPALTHGTWLCLTLSAAIFDESVNAINFEGNKVSMDATRRLWGCILAGGFGSPPDGSNLGKLLKNVVLMSGGIRSRAG